MGANVFLQGTYDGSTTDENGNFSFKGDIMGYNFVNIFFKWLYMFYINSV